MKIKITQENLITNHILLKINQDRDQDQKKPKDKILKDFGIVVFDINGLKLINDTKGHEEGDKLIKFDIINTDATNPEVRSIINTLELK